MKPLVSILIPAYNAEKTIEETIKSGLSQTWSNIELIIVDDGSTDRTFYISKKYESKKVKVIRQGNKGASSARNTALAVAQGEYIQWLDADDLLHPEKISLQLMSSEIDRVSPLLLTSSFGTFYHRPQKAIFSPTALWQDLPPLEWIITKLSDNVWMNPAVLLVGRKLSDLAGPWDERLSLDDDGEYISRVVSISNRVKFIRNARCYYRVGNIGSLSNHFNRSKKKSESVYLSCCLQIKYLLRLENSERTRYASMNALQATYVDIFPENIELVEKASDLSKQLGGNLSPPKLNYKYMAIQKLFGWDMAIKAMLLIRYAKKVAISNFDKSLYLFNKALQGL